MFNTPTTLDAAIAKIESLQRDIATMRAGIDRDMASQERATKAICKVRMNEHAQSIVEALQAYYKGGCGIEYVHDRVMALNEAISAL
jgi:hypothetical protein